MNDLASDIQFLAPTWAARDHQFLLKFLTYGFHSRNSPYVKRLTLRPSHPAEGLPWQTTVPAEYFPVIVT